MDTTLTLVVALQVATCSVVLAGLVAGFYWGRFAAAQALEAHSGRIKAYTMALLPPLAFALGMILDSNFARLANQIFWVLGAPATIGAFLRYHQKEEI